MARDEAKRAAVRKLLKTRRGREMSDREAARELGCGRYLVGSVRRELIFAGLHPAVEPSEIDPPSCPRSRMYRPGTSVRGGYVYDERGAVVPKDVWERRQRKARSR